MTTKKEYFDSAAENWDECCRHDPEKINRLLDLPAIKTGDRILDVGTGTGVLIPFLLKRIGESGSITAADISDKMLEIAERKFPQRNVAYLCTDILTAKLPENAFDCAVCYSAFPHFDDKQRAVDVMARSLKPGGQLLIAHSQNRQEINRMHHGMTGAVAGDTLPDMSAIRRYFQNAGLMPIREIDSDKLFAILGKKE